MGTSWGAVPRRHPGRGGIDDGSVDAGRTPPPVGCRTRRTAWVDDDTARLGLVVGRGGRTCGMDATDRRARRFRSDRQRVAHSSSGHVWLGGLARRPVGAPWNAALGLSSGAAGEPQPVSQHAAARGLARGPSTDARRTSPKASRRSRRTPGELGSTPRPRLAAGSVGPSWATGRRARLDPRRSCPGQGRDPPGFLGRKRWPKPDNALSMADHRGGWKGSGALQPHVLAPVRRHWRNPADARRRQRR